MTVSGTGICRRWRMLNEKVVGDGRVESQGLADGGQVESRGRFRPMGLMDQGPLTVAHVIERFEPPSTC